MNSENFKSIDWKQELITVIYREKLFTVGSHVKREQLIALRGVYSSQPAHFLTWVRCENVEICEEPHLISKCCQLPVTTHHTEGHPTFHQCSYCLTATATIPKEGLHPANRQPESATDH